MTVASDVAAPRAGEGAAVAGETTPVQNILVAEAGVPGTGTTGGPRLSAAELASLAVRAATPAERQRRPFQPVVSGPATASAADAEAEARYRLWMDYVSKGDPVIFARVLGWRGIDPGLARAALGPAALQDPAILPDWIADLQAMLAPGPTPRALPYIDPAEPLPHEALFGAFVEAASQAPLLQLRRLGAAPGALAGLQRRLLAQLIQLAAPVLAAPDALAEFPRRLFLGHPVLARLVVRHWRNWIDATTELLGRLEADGAALAGFLELPALPPLAGLRVEDADGHDGGRTVVTVVFEGGVRVVYKPRNMALDYAFAQLLEQLAGGGVDLRGAVPAVLRREGYGWAAFIEHRHAADEAERIAFWTWSGMLLGVVTALGGTDMHSGNVIAAGPRLVVVDLETVLRPTIPTLSTPRWPDDMAIGEFARRIEASVLGTTMVAAVLSAGQANVIDVGALTGPGFARAPHRPSAGAVEEDLLRYHAPLQAGFQHGLRGMREMASAICAPGGALDAFRGVPVRVVFRDTNIYGRLLLQSCRAAALQDAADRDVVLERLARMLAPLSEPPAYVGLVAVEKQSLEALDIPRFEAAADSTDLRDAHGVVVSGFFATDALTGVRRRLAALTEADEALQTRILGLALQVRLAGQLAPDDTERSYAPAAGPVAAPLDGARAVGRLLGRLALRGPQGDAVWPAPTFKIAERHLAFTGVDLNLGDGVLGIAVFLAALAQATGEAEFAELRDAALMTLRLQSDVEGYRSLAAPPLGLFDGLAGQVWGFAALARLGGPGWCLQRAAEMLQTGLGVATTSPTLAGGSGALLLAALALDTAVPGGLDDAVLRHLVERTTSDLRGSTGEVATGSFISGVAGAGHALAVAAQRLEPQAAGETPLRATAARALTTAPPENGFGASWGRGAAGRYLVRRAAAVGADGASALSQSRNLAGRELLASRVPLHDSIWNGRAGVIAALRDAGEARHAATIAAGLAGHAVAGSLQPVSPMLPGVVLPGLMNGVAGIGYVLLQEAGATIPDLLLFQ